MCKIYGDRTNGVYTPREKTQFSDVVKSLKWSSMYFLGQGSRCFLFELARGTFGL